MLSSFTITETENFEKKIRGRFRSVYNKLTNYIYPQLRGNPFFGPNIKKLKGELEGIYRYRTGRIFYTIDTDRKMIFIIDIDDRKDIYK